MEFQGGISAAVALGGDGDDVDGQVEGILRGSAEDPGVYRRLRQSTTGTLNVSTLYVLNFGTPAAGKVWNIRAIYFDVAPTSGNPFTETNQCKGLLGVGSPPIAPAQQGITYGDIISGNMATPFPFTWANRTYVVHTAEYLYLVISTPATVDFTSVYANIGVEEVDEPEFLVGAL